MEAKILSKMVNYLVQHDISPKCKYQGPYSPVKLLSFSKLMLSTFYKGHGSHVIPKVGGAN